MTVVRKKSRQSSCDDLKAALSRLIYLLEGQDEDEAVADLKKTLSELEKSQPQSEEFQACLGQIVEAFEGEHELSAYTYKREKKDEKWTEVDELFLASTSVISLVRRLNQKK